MAFFKIHYSYKTDIPIKQLHIFLLYHFHLNIPQDISLDFPKQRQRAKVGLFEE